MLVMVMGWRDEEIRMDNRRVAVGALVPMRVVLFRMRVESRQQQQDWQQKGEEAGSAREVKRFFSIRLRKSYHRSSVREKGPAAALGSRAPTAPSLSLFLTPPIRP